MKPFADIVMERNALGLDGYCLWAGGERISCVEGPVASRLLNFVFESRLKEELEKFRERAVSLVRKACIDCHGDGFIVGEDHGCGGDSVRCLSLCPVQVQVECRNCAWATDAIRAMPLFETEEKP